MELSFWKPSILKQSNTNLEEFMESEELKQYKHVIENLIKSKKSMCYQQMQKKY